MGLTKKSVFLVLIITIISSACAFNTLLSWDKEMIYDYKALVKAGTHLPASYASQFILHGKLHLQANNNSTYVKLTDLKYKLYNGKLDHVHEHEAQDVPLPTEVADLMEVFKIVYDPHGKVMGIATKTSEKQYTRNIKRAIASILQLDTSVIKNLERPRAFMTEENSIYGYSNVLYNAFKHGDDAVMVHKMHDMPSTHHMYKFTVTNLEEDYCEIPYEDPLIHDSQRKYFIVKQGDHQIIKHIEANGGFYYQPFKGKSETQYLFVNQTFNLIDANVPITQQFQVSSGEHFENSLTFHMFDESESGVIDLTNGRRTMNIDKAIPEVYEMLEEVYDYLGKDHLNTETPDIKKGQVINRLQRLLVYFDINKLEEVYNTLSTKTTDHDKAIFKIFLHYLPLIGTKSSTLFIKKLIVQKKVDEDVCKDLLQNMAEHIKAPTQSLITEMKELMHLNENIHWNVRKVAILTFGSLVHKADAWHKRIHHQNDVHYTMHKQPLDNGKYHYDDDNADSSDAHNVYEKYVVDLATKIKATSDYQMQLAYLGCLFNMQHESVLKHLEPAIKGEWWPNHHFRLRALWAITPVVLKHPDKVYEFFWPVLSNRNEHTELRVFAYYVIMQSHPTLSKLTNIFWVLMNEPNEEVYNYHYTYMKGMMQTTDLCHQYYKIKTAQLIKYMHPPAHGTSMYTQASFTDTLYGFGGGIQTNFVQTNESFTFVFSTHSQLYRKLTEDDMIVFKIHGLEQKFEDVFKIATGSTMKLFNIEELLRIIAKIPISKTVRMELTWIKNQHMLNTFYFDESNLKEVALLFDFFVNDQPQTVIKDLLYMNYEKYTKLFMPTDLGFLFAWDFLMPVVQKYRINMAKEVVNKVINVKMDNKYVNWIHYRHGLSTYNPIVDVWQGINKYHSFDIAFPMYCDLTINTQQQSVQLSIKTHEDVQKNIAGIRSHAASIVFVKDDFHRNLLKQSTPKAVEFVFVSNGDKYRKDFVISRKDDLNLGRKWMIQIYDTEHHITNGTFNEFMSAMVSSKGKSFNTPFTHLWMTYYNFYYSALYSADEGMGGFLLRIAPSTDYSVSNIDLSFRLNQEVKREGFVFAPGMKVSGRMTYAVKNKEKSLKTWDVNAILDMNPGHTVNNLKMHFTRIIPGQKDYKICMEGVKKWTEKSVSGHMNVAMSQSEDGKCVKDDTVIDVAMTGERSKEQEQDDYKYGSCQYIIPYFKEHYHTMNCLAAHSSVRKYVYNVKTTKVPTEFKKTLLNWWDTVKSSFMRYYTYRDEHTENIGDNNFKVDVLYPMSSNEVDMQVVTPSHMYELSSVPMEYLKTFGIGPDTTMYSTWYMYLHSMGLVHHCTVYHNHFIFDHHYQVQREMKNDWTLYLGETAQNPQQAVYIKSIGDNKIALKLVEKTNYLEIIPQGDSYKFVMNGQQMPMDYQIHSADWIMYQVLTHDNIQPVTMTMPHFGVHLEFNKHMVQIVLPKTDHPWYGSCYM